MNNSVPPFDMKASDKEALNSEKSNKILINVNVQFWIEIDGVLKNIFAFSKIEPLSNLQIIKKIIAKYINLMLLLNSW